MVAGGPAAPDVQVKLRDTPPLTAAIPDESDNEPDWADKWDVNSRVVARTNGRRAVIRRTAAEECQPGTDSSADRKFNASIVAVMCFV